MPWHAVFLVSWSSAGPEVLFLIRTLKDRYLISKSQNSGFGGLEVACWHLVPKFAGWHPAEAVGFLGRKNPQHAFLRRGSKTIGPMS